MRKALIVSLLVIALCPVPLLAAVPHLIRYQGQAVDTNGVPLEGPYTLTFRLYDVETAGIPLWEEIQPNVPLATGHFSVLLGAINPLTAMNWSQPCWLAVKVNSESELTPRQRITSVPLAITAEKLAVPITTSTVSDDANRLVPAGAILLWKGAACPAGYTRVTDYDNQFLVSADTAVVTGGSLTHTHGAGTYRGPSHTHSVPYSGWGAYTINGQPGQLVLWSTTALGAAQANNLSGPGGAEPVTGESAAIDSRPPFKTILMCQKD